MTTGMLEKLKGLHSIHQLFSFESLKLFKYSNHPKLSPEILLHVKHLKISNIANFILLI